jgi:tRNA(Arg) A34 adenosine deaminase TadA
MVHLTYPMSMDRRMLATAAEAAKEYPERRDNRSFILGAVGLRNDGVLVTARNIAAQDVVPTHHAEARVVRKLTPNSVVWVARVSKATGEWTMSKPCQSCEGRMRAAGVKKVVYTIAPNEWGTLYLSRE